MKNDLSSIRYMSGSLDRHLPNELSNDALGRARFCPHLSYISGVVFIYIQSKTLQTNLTIHIPSTHMHSGPTSVTFHQLITTL
jgi:hypothetical protein